jgi:AraC-like DNA-binding protein
MEHCAINLTEGNSHMVYFKDEQMNLLFDLNKDAQLVAILIDIEHFHSLFAFQRNFLFNFGNFKTGKPIIEPKETSKSVKGIINQLISHRTTETLRPIFVKGKDYELLSYYFSTTTETNQDHCPYIDNEEIISKIIQVKELIIENMNNPPSLEELSKMVGLNIKKLKTNFKEFYGMPVFSFLLNYKMELAKKLLIDQKYNVNELASYLGYSASSHFIAAFKRKYNITPKQFSKSIQ